MKAYKYVAKCDFFLGDFFVNEGDTVHLSKDISEGLSEVLIDKACINGVLSMMGNLWVNRDGLKECLERVHCRGDFNEKSSVWDTVNRASEKFIKQGGASWAQGGAHHGKSGDTKSPPIGEGGTGVRVIDMDEVYLYANYPTASPINPKHVEIRLKPEIKKREIISVEGELFRVYESIVMIKAVKYEN